MRTNRKVKDMELICISLVFIILLLLIGCGVGMLISNNTTDSNENITEKTMNKTVTINIESNINSINETITINIESNIKTLNDSLKTVIETEIDSINKIIKATLESESNNINKNNIKTFSPSVINDNSITYKNIDGKSSVCIKNTKEYDTAGISMFPALHKNQHLITREVDNYESLVVGNIIFFRHAYSVTINYIGHRIIEKGYDSNGLYFITKGDNNAVNDGKIRPGQIYGVVVGVIY